MERNDLKNLIEEIVKAVVEKLYENKGEPPKKDSSGNGKKDKGNIIVVFTGAPGLLSSVLEGLMKLKEGYSLIVAFSEAAKKMDQFKGLEDKLGARVLEEKNLYKEINNANFIILPTLTQNTAAKIAWGIRDCIASEIVACGLLMNKKVIAASDSLEVENISSPYKILLEEITNRLVKLGIKLCKASEIVSLLESGEKSSSRVEESREAFSFKERVLTNEVAMKVAAQGYSKILITSKCLITPLAYDFLKDKKIEIVRGID